MESGIQEDSGGVARYHLLDKHANLPVSTEITGYTISALVWGATVSGQQDLLRHAFRAADFLIDVAWQPELSAIPFELGTPLPPYYFFDAGIIVRGLLAAWRAGGRTEYLTRAQEIGQAMGQDFRKGEDIAPILLLPSKEPLPYEPRWSREPGCFTLKAAMAWAELDELFPGGPFGSWYEQALRRSLETHTSFLPGSEDNTKVMDRLHAYCYFLEALQGNASQEEVQEALRYGIEKVAALLRRIGPMFERSDVCAQLLRVRLLADAKGVLPLDVAAAEYEAARCEAYQSTGDEPMRNGGFVFGTKSGAPLPFMNPVSTAFCMQAVTWWREWQAGVFRGDHRQLV